MTVADLHPSAPLPSNNRLVAITFDERSIGRSNANVEHEREVAIYDILDANEFVLDGRGDGPYRLVLGIAEDRLVLSVAPDAKPEDVFSFMLSLAPLRRVIKDYMLICESYYQAIKHSTPAKIQAIDMGRRGLHDEGSRLLDERLAGKVKLDRDTSRRLFTLIVALHWKG